MAVMAAVAQVRVAAKAVRVAATEPAAMEKVPRPAALVTAAVATAAGEAVTVQG